VVKAGNSKGGSKVKDPQLLKSYNRINKNVYKLYDICIGVVMFRKCVEIYSKEEVLCTYACMKAEM
jgi:hypothetical protein